MDLDAVAERLGLLVGAPADSDDVLSAVGAAASWVLVATGVAVHPVTPADLLLLPDDPQQFQGMIGFSRALYLDAMASRGASVLIGDQTVDTVFTPEDLWRHWHHYFDPMTIQWGVA